MDEEVKASDHEGERDVRIAKVQKMKTMGIIPYAQSFDKKNLIWDIIHDYETKKYRDIVDIISNPETQVQTAGRMMLYRTHGKLAFAKLLDSTAEIQLMFHRDNCKIITSEWPANTLKDGNKEGMSAYKFIEKMVDIGDFIGVRGEIFQTHKGELTIFVSECTFLSKAIRPLPEKFHGLQDQEELYRKRYLDLTMNPETYKRFLLKSKLYQTLREFYTEEWFTEIQTNILGNSASGAAARPFVTHHNDYDADMFLRIAFETWLKKATVGRFEKVFEIGQDFRNEWSDPSHLQEFTQVEHYAVYWNYEDNMKFTEKMFDYLFKKLGISKKINIKDKEGNIKEVDFTTPRKRIDFTKGIEESSGIDITKYSMDGADRLRTDIQKKGNEFEWMHKMWTVTLIDCLYKKTLRPKIIGPAFIYNYPVIMQPLARISDKDKNIVEQFQLLVNGREMCKAYSELVDPIVQQENFDKQGEAAAKGDEEATASDDDFVTAMEYGMPPQSGFGMGIERLLAILTEQDNIRDVVMFPLMKAQTKQKEMEICEVTIDDVESIYGKLPALEDVENLAKKYLKETYRHCLDVAKVMKYFANKLHQNEEIRYIAGLLHDIDRDLIGKDPNRHLWKEFEKIVGEIHLPQCLIDDIKSHYTSKTSVSVSSLLRRYLISVDELTGFIYAVALMRPTGLEWMDHSSVKKKLKDKKFAAWVDRQEASNCEKYLAIPLDEFVYDIIKALQ